MSENSEDTVTDKQSSINDVELGDSVCFQMKFVAVDRLDWPAERQVASRCMYASIASNQQLLKISAESRWCETEK